MGKYFGTDGFRGEANVVLTVEHAFKVGRFLGWYFGQDHKAKIVIGKDTRRSSYMFEDALSALGFEDICTESYRYRSEIVDQVLDFVTQENDVAAYALATKSLRSVDGAERTLILATVRGSYGAEWFSNLKMQEARADAAPSADHTGYTQAADELYQRVAAMVEQERAAGYEPAVLLCGHSRGGAIANIVAARLLDRYAQGSASSGSYAVSVGPSGSSGEGSLVPVSTGVQASAAGDSRLPVYAYTFAAPAVTTNPDIHADRYSGIFNIQNPADLMPQLPLERWGYGRYGQDIALPGAGDAAFSRLYDDMRERFVQNVGVESAYDPRDRATVDEAYAGDIVGLFDPGIFSIGDTVCTPSRRVQYAGIPTFAPEHFARVSQVDTLKRKQFVKGMEELAQEGAIQIFRELGAGMESVIVGVVGELQFDVLEQRLKSEYHVAVRRQPLGYTDIRWIQGAYDEDAVRSLNLTRDTLRVEDMRGGKLLLFTSPWNVDWANEHNPGLTLSEFGNVTF